jgi:hypothetical protein
MLLRIYLFLEIRHSFINFFQISVRHLLSFLLTFVICQQVVAEIGS